MSPDVPRRILLLTLWVLPVGAVSAAGLRLAEERYVPTGWTQPRVTTDNGVRTIIPSIPEGFERRTFGASISTRTTTIHGPHPRSSPDEPREFQLRLNDGRRIVVEEGAQFSVSGKHYQVIGIHADELLIRALENGRVLRLTRRAPPPPPDFEPVSPGE